MNIILLQDQDFVSTEEVRLEGGRAQHINNVLRAGIGDRLKIGVLNQRLGNGIITRITTNEVRMSISQTGSAPDPCPVSLILALPRPKVLRRIIRSVAELGIKRLTLLNSYRVEKSYWQSPALDRETIDTYLKEGLAQAGDTILPRVTLEKRFKPFVEDRLGALCQSKTAVVAHPGEASENTTPVRGEILLAIGPEGGFIPYEINKLQCAGFKRVKLGERILRVETAVPFAVAALTHATVARG